MCPESHPLFVRLCLQGVSFLFGRSTELDVAFTRSFSCRYYPQYDGNNLCITSGVYEATAQTPFITQLRLQPGVEMSLNEILMYGFERPFLLSCFPATRRM